MSKVQSPKSKIEEDISGELSIIDGELLEVSDGEEVAIEQKNKLSIENKGQRTKDSAQISNRQSTILNYLFLPFIFLTVALLGGLRLGAQTSDFLFLKPPLVCLIFATVLLILFFRANLIRFEGWFSENFSTLKNVANATVLLTLFAASTQVFNALLPESGLPFWVIAFCFFWTLWNNLFAEFETKKLLKSLGGLFGLAFVVKYLLLANLTAPASESWWQGIFQNPTKEAFTYLLDLPRFAVGTGYIQFFTLIFYLIGLFLVPPVLSEEK
ncbi:MAG: hypothetical protein LC768_07500 [Acidobacteria bacterium]|nr:hypothetical protein [Acidobacteriota bacterium]MCA1638167.1 hypothetical protein [Acidobacteriota bacterium]